MRLDFVIVCDFQVDISIFSDVRVNHFTVVGLMVDSSIVLGAQVNDPFSLRLF